MTGPSDVSRPQDLDARYVAARRVLLDALTVLAPHGDAVILAGAQAVYLHTYRLTPARDTHRDGLAVLVHRLNQIALQADAREQRIRKSAGQIGIIQVSGAPSESSPLSAASAWRSSSSLLRSSA